MDSIIFDVDGTLWNATDTCAIAWTKVVRQDAGLDQDITPEILQGLFGQTLSDIADIVFKGFPKEERMRLINLCCEEEHRMLLADPAPLYPRLEDTLKALSEKYRLFIVSNCQAGYIEVFLKATGLGHYFEGHLCPGDTGNAKAANIAQVIREYHLENPVYVGDTLGDYIATKENQIPFIFAAYGFGQVDAPDDRIETPWDLATHYL